jgi:hypothetical protein
MVAKSQFQPAASDGVDLYYTALERSFHSALAHLPTADLEDEREYTGRRLVEVERSVTICDDLVTAFSWIEILGARLSWLDEELRRRRTVDASRVCFARQRIPVDFIQDLRGRVDLAMLVMNEYPETRLKRAGTGYSGHCPFHPDSSPSLHVWPTEGRWWCFGCNQGGDCFDVLLVGSRAQDFRDAVELVAAFVGVPLPAPRPFTPRLRSLQEGKMSTLSTASTQSTRQQRQQRPGAA